MIDPPYITVELQIAATGSDLAPALEAAQYGRVIRPDEPENEREADAMLRFIEAFGAATEAWEADAAVTLAGLSAPLEALESLGLYVHAGATRASLGETRVPIPVAVLTITRRSLPVVPVMLSSDLEVAGDDVTSH